MGSTENLDANVLFSKFEMSSGSFGFFPLGLIRNGIGCLLSTLAHTDLQNLFGLSLMFSAKLSS